MGSFANTVFSILLGWLQGLIAMIWSALTAEGGDTFLQFIGKNWITIALFLCTIGLIADFAVYLFRWEPWKVWRTFFRKLRNRKQGQSAETKEAGVAEGTAPAAMRAGHYFASSDAAEEPPEDIAGEMTGAAYDAGPEEMPEEKDDLYRWREQEPEYMEPGIPDEVTKAGYRVPADSPYRKPADREAPRNRRRRLRINLLGDSEDEDAFHYVTPEPIVDQRDAYYAPVYPKNWTGEKEDGEQDS